MKIINFGVVIFISLLFTGCGESESNIINNIIESDISNVPHPIPNPSPNAIESDEFPPRAPII